MLFPGSHHELWSGVFHPFVDSAVGDDDRQDAFDDRRLSQHPITRKGNTPSRPKLMEAAFRAAAVDDGRPLAAKHVATTKYLGCF